MLKKIGLLLLIAQIGAVAEASSNPHKAAGRGSAKKINGGRGRGQVASKPSPGRGISEEEKARINAVLRECREALASLETFEAVQDKSALRERLKDYTQDEAYSRKDFLRLIEKFDDFEKAVAEKLKKQEAIARLQAQVAAEQAQREVEEKRRADEARLKAVEQDRLAKEAAAKAEREQAEAARLKAEDEARAAEAQRVQEEHERLAKEASVEAPADAEKEAKTPERASSSQAGSDVEEDDGLGGDADQSEEKAQDGSIQGDVNEIDDYWLIDAPKTSNDPVWDALVILEAASEEAEKCAGMTALDRAIKADINERGSSADLIYDALMGKAKISKDNSKKYTELLASLKDTIFKNNGYRGIYDLEGDANNKLQGGKNAPENLGGDQGSKGSDDGKAGDQGKGGDGKKDNNLNNQPAPAKQPVDDDGKKKDDGTQVAMWRRLLSKEGFAGAVVAVVATYIAYYHVYLPRSKAAK